jgi:hypothetical protein
MLTYSILHTIDRVVAASMCIRSQCTVQCAALIVQKVAHSTLNTVFTAASDTTIVCHTCTATTATGRLLTAKEYSMEQARFGDRTVAEATLTQSLNIKYNAPPNAVLSALSAAIFWGLQGRIRQTCKSLYPIVSTCTFTIMLTVSTATATITAVARQVLLHASYCTLH